MSNDRLSAAALSDNALLSHLRVLAGREREATADVVAHLAELDARRLYLGEGYGSLFVYCTSALRLSEHAAYNRIEAARAARKFPVVLDLLADGSLNLATLRRLAPHLTVENHTAILAEAKGLSRRHVELLIARLAPQPDVPCSIRKVSVPASSEPSLAPPHATTEALAPRTPSLAAIGRSPDTQDSGASASCASASSAPAPSGPRLDTRRTVIAPLSPGRYRLQLTVEKDTHDRLQRVRDLLRREIPDGDVGAIFDRALSLLLAQIEKKKLAATAEPRSGRPSGPA